MNLCDLEVNHECIIKKLNTEGAIHQRLQDIGIIPGNIIKCILISPFKDPKAYKINGTLIAIRKEDSKKIEVEEIE